MLLSAQGMDVPAIAKVAFTSEDRVRDVIRNFNADGFSSLYPKYRGGHPPKFTLGQRREIKKIAKSKPAEHDLPFSTWSLDGLADFPVAGARRECLDRMLITGERHLRLVLGEYIDHYDTHRPHRTLRQSPPAGRSHAPAPSANVRVLRRDRLGGLIREYSQVA